MSEEIARVEFGERRIRTALGKESVVQPQVVVDNDNFDNPLWTFSQNGWQGTGVNISVEMFDALRQLVNDPRVVKHYDSLREPKYELSCGGDPVLAYKPRTLRNNQLNKEHEL